MSKATRTFYLFVDVCWWHCLLRTLVTLGLPLETETASLWLPYTRQAARAHRSLTLSRPFIMLLAGNR